MAGISHSLTHTHTYHTTYNLIMTAVITLLLLLLSLLSASIAFTVPSTSTVLPHSRQSLSFRISTSSQKRTPPAITSITPLQGLFDDDDQPTTIPPDIRDEIYAAEANTPAAQGRQQRILVYILLTIVGVTTAFFNAFLSDLRYGDGAPSTDLNYYGFGWVQDNFLTSFLFTNKIGGGLGLLGAGLSGTVRRSLFLLPIHCEPFRMILCILLPNSWLRWR